MRYIIAILIFGIIVTFHELGHFLLARVNGITVTEFSLGMGPRLVSHVTKSGTRISWKLLPFGGSCMMLGEDEGAEVGEGSFGSKSVWARLSVVAAGPLFNVFMAFVCSIIIVGVFGYDEPVVASVTEGYPAKEAGIDAGDRIVSLNGSQIYLFRDIGVYMFFHSDEKEITVTYERDGKTDEVTIMPQKKEDGYSYLGVVSGGMTKGNLLQVLQYSVYEVRYWIVNTFKSLGALFTGKVSLNDLSGPVGVISYMGDTYKAAAKISYSAVASSMLNITILLSVNLGIMNLLPIPALDGGRILFLLIEAIRRKRIDPEKEGKIHLIGLALLLALMMYVMFHDVWTLIK